MKMETNLKTMESKDTVMQPLKGTTSQGLILQTYCNSVLAQPSVNFGNNVNLKKYEADINSSLVVAKNNANHYQKDIQKNILTNISNMWNYYELQSCVPTVCPEGSTERQWLDVLKGMQEQAETYKAECDYTSNMLIDLNKKLGVDAGNFTKTLSDLNSTVGGDQGTLASLQKSISKVDRDISGCIAGTVLGGLAIAGGVFMTAVGGIADFITAGTSTPLVIGGVVVIAAGVAAEIGSGVALASLYKQKSGLLTSQTSLTNEVRLANGIKGAYDNLASTAKSAMDASMQMSNAWRLLGGDLHNLAEDLDKGRRNTAFTRTLFLTAANGIIPIVKGDLTIIKGQMAGVKVQTVNGMPLAEYILKQVHAA